MLQSPFANGLFGFTSVADKPFRLRVLKCECIQLPLHDDNKDDHKIFKRFPK